MTNLREGKITAVANALVNAGILELDPASGAAKSHARDVINALRVQGWAIIAQGAGEPVKRAVPDHGGQVDHDE